jgi:hypothetical protein
MSTLVGLIWAKSHLIALPISGSVKFLLQELRVPAFGCLHMLGVTCACLFDARVGICDQGSTRACACCARACSWVSSHAWCHLRLFI